MPRGKACTANGGGNDKGYYHELLSYLAERVDFVAMFNVDRTFRNAHIRLKVRIKG